MFVGNNKSVITTCSKLERQLTMDGSTQAAVTGFIARARGQSSLLSRFGGRCQPGRDDSVLSFT